MCTHHNVTFLGVFPAKQDLEAVDHGVVLEVADRGVGPGVALEAVVESCSPFPRALSLSLSSSCRFLLRLSSLEMLTSRWMSCHWATWPAQ